MKNYVVAKESKNKRIIKKVNNFIKCTIKGKKYIKISKNAHYY